LCGVDLTKYFPDEIPQDTKVLWERWTRCAMGLRSSPYQACQGMMWALEIIFGDRNNAKNVFRFSQVRLNLPGEQDYNPLRPWVYKERSDGSIASDVHVYVDDLRTTGATEEECWSASQRVSSVLASLGLQDAARKRRAADLNAGAWKGSVVNTSDEKVTVLATHDKWLKLKAILLWLEENRNELEGMDHKLLEQKRGFLVHMVQTYPALNPYLKGVHGTLDSWRRNRDENGFRMHDDAKRPREDDAETGEETNPTNTILPRTSSKKQKVEGALTQPETHAGSPPSSKWPVRAKNIEQPEEMFRTQKTRCHGRKNLAITI
jgi:hypothetical protein